MPNLLLFKVGMYYNVRNITVTYLAIARHPHSVSVTFRAGMRERV